MAWRHRMGRNATTLGHELRGQGTAKLGMEDVAIMTDFSDDNRVLEAWNAQRGLLVIAMPQIPTGPLSTCLDKLSSTAREFSDLVKEVAGDLGDNRVSDNELKRIEREAAELLASVHQLLGAARELNASEPRS